MQNSSPNHGFFSRLKNRSGSSAFKSFRMSALLGVCIALLFAAIGIGLVDAQTAPSRDPKAQAAPYDVVIPSKLHCSLRRQVIMPFRGTITNMKAEAGQAVKKGDVLVQYRLFPDVAQQLNRQIAALQIKDLEVSVANIDKTLNTLETKRIEAKHLVDANMAPAINLSQIEKDIQYQRQARAATQEKLQYERQLAKEHSAYLQELLGGSLKPVGMTKDASLVSPIDGNVVAILPDARKGAEVAAGAPVMVIGVIDPMILRAQIHETDIVSISMGKKAEVTLESLPGRKFEATVTRMSLVPLVPGLEQPSYYEIELTVPNPDHVLREGFKGQVTFHLSRPK